MSKLHLEQNDKGYEVLNEKFNWLGDMIPMGKKVWGFKAVVSYTYTVAELREIAKLLKGLNQ